MEVAEYRRRTINQQKKRTFRRAKKHGREADLRDVNNRLKDRAEAWGMLYRLEHMPDGTLVTIGDIRLGGNDN
jgi:hypothetical protein